MILRKKFSLSVKETMEQSDFPPQAIAWRSLALLIIQRRLSVGKQVCHTKSSNNLLTLGASTGKTPVKVSEELKFGEMEGQK